MHDPKSASKSTPKQRTSIFEKLYEKNISLLRTNDIGNNLFFYSLTENLVAYAFKCGILVNFV